MRAWLLRVNAFLFVMFGCGCCVAYADTLEEVRARGELIWGADREGGGPYLYPRSDDPNQLTGFERDLAEALSKELGVRSRFQQGPWDNLPGLLGTRNIDLVLNGYELNSTRAAQYLYSVPYYIFEMSLVVRKDNQALTSWNDLKPNENGRKPRVGVLTNSAAMIYLQDDQWASDVEVVNYDSSTDALDDVVRGKIDASLCDWICFHHYRERFSELGILGENVGRGYYVMLFRDGDDALRNEVDRALMRLMESGELRRIYERYGIWTREQGELVDLVNRIKEAEAEDTDRSQVLGIKPARERGWRVIASRGPLLLRSAGMTILLSFSSMPIAMGLGLLLAISKLYGPWYLRSLVTCYIELLRGTPLMLQLYFIFYLLPEIGISVGPVYAAIAGLAINYSAYEAEIYRAGLEAIPKGQMEAALALGMTKPQALWRIIIPQAFKLVLPPVTNDFIALFKDTSVCSAVTLVELTKQYSIQKNDTGAVLELAAVTALLYMAMSVPMARVVDWLEKKTKLPVRAK